MLMANYSPINVADPIVQLTLRSESIPIEGCYPLASARRAAAVALLVSFELGRRDSSGAPEVLEPARRHILALVGQRKSHRRDAACEDEPKA